MPQFPEPQAARLLRFNVQIIEQALSLVAEHALPGRPAYAGPVGAHLRHVIEHHEALLFPACTGVVDYDQRPRNRDVERSAGLARTRLVALQARMASWTDAEADSPVTVHGQGGLSGEFGFVVESTLGRELAFVASHAVHHFALLQVHCTQQGIATAADFGKAPATVAHERNSFPTDNPVSTKDASCNTSHLFG